MMESNLEYVPPLTHGDGDTGPLGGEYASRPRATLTAVPNATCV